MLGPLCVAFSTQNLGIGKTLVEKGLEAVREQTGLPVLLVGDAPYYAPLGFEVARGIKMPVPVDYARLLIAWPHAEAACDREAYQGVIQGLPSLAIPHGG